MEVGVVAVAEERLGVARQDRGVQVPQDFDLVFSADAGEYGPNLGIAEGSVQVLGPLGGEACLARVVGYSTGRSPNSSRNRVKPSSNGSGEAAGPPHEGESTATASPRWGLGGYVNVGAIGCSALESSQISGPAPPANRLPGLRNRRPRPRGRRGTVSG